MPYSIHEHKHRFAAWAASTAASVKGCRFKVKQGKKILEGANLHDSVKELSDLPDPDEFDKWHKSMTKTIREEASKHNDKHGQPLSFSYGVAAKLLNMYLKSIFVCTENHNHEKVKAIHPPIDNPLLDKLTEIDFHKSKSLWGSARNKGWSKLSETEYMCLIRCIREGLGGKGLWEIEEFWRGYQ